VSGTLAKLFGRPVDVSLDQYRVGTAAQAEAAQVASARSGGAQAADHAAELLALAAGADADSVTVDREHKRATVRAAVLPGARLAAYRQLEGRVAAAEPSWQIALIPPAAALDPVSFDGDAPDPAGQAAVATAIWGAQRTGLAIGVAGAKADAVVALLQRGGAVTETVPGSGDAVTLSWRTPATP
jgi:hypothetical protein